MLIPEYIPLTWIGFASAFILALVLTPLSRSAALRLGHVDKPDRGLKKHGRVVPYGGGYALYFSTAIPLLVLSINMSPMIRGRLLVALAGGTVVFIVGALDDIWKLSPGWKIFGQFLGALVAIMGGIKVGFIASPGLTIFITIFWILAVTNAINLMDIMDGLATGTVFIAALGFFVVSLPMGVGEVDLAAATIAGAALAFLRYNFAPAKIFMGDAGSLYLGFMLSVLAIGAKYTHVSPAALFCPILILGLPLFDMILVTVLRTLRGIPFYRGTPDHVALRLRTAGLSVRTTVIAMWGLSGALSLLALLITRLSTERAVFLYMAIGMVLLVAGQLLADLPVAPKKKKRIRKK